MNPRRLTPLVLIMGFFIAFVCLCSPSFLYSQEESGQDIPLEKIEKRITEFMDEGDIPGLSLVIVREGQPDVIKGFGYADLEKKRPVTPATYFELCSTSKAFTALAAMKCEADGLIDLDAPASKYLPWFYATYKGEKQEITLRQFLHQTSGLPFKSIARIPEDDDAGSLEQATRNLAGIELEHKPGTAFIYATANYDIIGAIIEKVTGMSYEDYMRKNILDPIGLTGTLVGVDKKNPPSDRALGYKIGFGSPRLYDAPVFRGNNPAGYILSNGNEMARWLKLHLGMIDSGFAPLIEKTHQPDESILPNRANFAKYAMGWFNYLDPDAPIDHGGNNPNFTAYVTFKPGEKTGVFVMANSNSNYTRFIGRDVMSMVRGKGPLPLDDSVNADIDKFTTVVSILGGLFILAIIFFYLLSINEIIKGRRKYEPLTLKKFGRLALSFLAFIPFVIGVYFLPNSMSNLPMKTALVWAPISFQVLILLILVIFAMCYIGIVLSTLFPHQNKYRRSLPMLIMLSMLAGGANAVVIFLVTSALFSPIDLVYQLYNYVMAFCIYIFGRKVLQTRLIRLTFDIVYDTRMSLVEKVFYTSYQKFEKVDRGRVFATLNDDTNQVSVAANIFVQLTTSVITTLGVFIYLAAIAFWATVVTIGLIIVIAVVYSVVTNKTQVYFNQARDTRDVYMRLLNGMIDGFKELSLQYKKKLEYKDEVADSCDQFRVKQSTALIKFINAFLIGESMLIVVLGAVGFGVPRFFPDLTTQTLMSFVMVLLYLIGPINGILNSIPQIAQVQISWRRIQEFMKDIPANMAPSDFEELDLNPKLEHHIEAQNLVFSYEAEEESERFAVGPLDFKAETGEIVFVIGGNGSGKTTLAKLLTGLYKPGQGSIKIDGKDVSDMQLSEYYSAIFSDYHLFQKLYNVDIANKKEEAEKYLKLLRLDEKVAIEDDGFSTIDLSGGQRKRLALLQCYLEDRPIYLFDEVAADQDPGFRKFFYRTLLPTMKEEGKIVIAVTHDDHYFDVADRLIKMDMGKIEQVEDGAKLVVTK